MTSTGQGAFRAKKTTSTIPIVMTASADAAKQGIVGKSGAPRRERYGHHLNLTGSSRQTTGASQTGSSWRIARTFFGLSRVFTR